MANISKDLLHLAGEYRVCSELLKRNVFATITYGNRKAVDVYAIGERKNKALRIEVKTSQKKRFVTSISQKEGLSNNSSAPDFWVLCQMKADDGGEVNERFFVLSHAEICRVQQEVNNAHALRYAKKHKRKPNLKRGVDNVKIEFIERFENAWGKITKAIG